jgi:hypothetical protein
MTATTFTAIVDAAEYVDRTLPTASWFDRYQIPAGEYPVTFVTADGKVTDDPSRAYYANIVVDAVLTESYRVNRLLSASHARTDTPNNDTTVTFRPYAYEVRDGAAVAWTHSDGRPTPFIRIVESTSATV